MICYSLIALLLLSALCQGSCILRQSRRNKYGDIQYEPAYKNVGKRWTPADLDPSQIWIVKNPTEVCHAELLALFPDLTSRQYGKNMFLMTQAAVDVVPEFNGGGSCACVIEAYNDDPSGAGEEYFLMVGDSKKAYLQNCQGRLSFTRSSSPTIDMRCILQEQLNLSVTEDELEPVGWWSVRVREFLVEIGWDRLSHAFHLRVPLSRLAHLLPSYFNSLPPPTGPMVIPCFLRPGLQALRGVTHLVLIPKASLEGAPEVIEVSQLVQRPGEDEPSLEVRRLDFNDHHRDFVRIRAGLPSKYHCPYLTSFQIDQRNK